LCVATAARRGTHVDMLTLPSTPLTCTAPAQCPSSCAINRSRPMYIPRRWCCRGFTNQICCQEDYRTETFISPRLRGCGRAPRFDDFVKQRGAKEGRVAAGISPQQFARVMAKIAHSYAVARLGLRGFRPLLLDLILGRDVQRAPELVGGDPQTPPPAGGKVHELDLLPHPKLVVVKIRLFASSSIEGEHAMPVYIVVAGETV
jgi:hypothetical protein